MSRRIADGSTELQQVLCRSLDRNVYSFPYWDDGSTGHSATVAMCAIGFDARDALALVLQRFDYNFGVGALMTTATAYATFDVPMEPRVIPKQAALYGDVAARDVATPLRLRVRDRTFVLAISRRQLGTFASLRNLAGEPFPEPAYFALAAERAIPRDYLFGRAGTPSTHGRTVVPWPIRG
jgi:hypothetical protein